MLLTSVTAQAEPPFGGTIFLDPDIITESDPTTFTGLTAAGRGSRSMYDRRANAFVTYNAYLFNATFNDGSRTVEVQVNPEFGSTEAARVEAEKYLPAIGRLPAVLRKDLETVWIHKGFQPFGGGNNNLLIHTEQGDSYAADGILEETFVHEAAHTSLDAQHANSAGWRSAQANDPDFISTYARDNPDREDVAESFLPWLALRYARDRISNDLANTISATIPNRIAYFDGRGFNMAPLSLSPEPGNEPAQPLNVSTRLRVQTGQDVMIGGFIITGTAPKKVIIRAIGPSLQQDGVAGALSDPTLELHNADGPIAANDNWADDDAQAFHIEASGVPPRSELESAIVASLEPGSYTAIVRGKNEATGIGLVEVYDLGQAADSLLANISTRGFVEAGENVMIGGFILGGGSADRRVVVRAIGASLQASGVANALADPTLELFGGNGDKISSNDNWKQSETGASQEGEVQATGVPPSNDLEAAIVANLPPGNYTAIVRGKSDGTGVGLVEVYALQQ